LLRCHAIARRLAADHDVDQLQRVEQRRQTFDVGERFGRLDKQNIGAGFDETVAALSG
jgi:hypothetical protein